MTDGPRHLASIEPQLSNQGYDRLKNFVTLVLPALIAFYLTSAQFVELPNPEAVAGIGTAAGTLLGIALKAFSRNHANVEAAKKAEAEAAFEYDGDIHFVKLDDDPAYLVLKVKDQNSVESIVDKDEVTFKVRVG